MTPESAGPDQREPDRYAEAKFGVAVSEHAPVPVESALRNGAVYAGAAAFQRGIIFILLPVYTRALAPADYGRLSVLLAIGSAAILLLSCGMDTAFFRTYFALRSDPQLQRRFVTTAWAFLLVVPPAVVAALALIAAALLSDGQVASPGEIALVLAGAALFVSASVVPFALLRAEERLKDYLLLSAVTAATTAGFTLVAVVALDGGVTGWLVAVIVANALTLAAAMRIIPFSLGHGIEHRLLRGALALGLPLLPHVLSHWGLGVSNRLILAGMVSTSKVGIYALAANIALPVAILMQGMAQGFMPSFARAATDKGGLRALERVVSVQFLVILATTVSGALFGPVAVHHLAPPEYAAAADLVPWLTLGYGFLGLYFIPMNAVALTAGRTGKVWVITFAAAATNLGCLIVLVPAHGLLGAAIAVPAGYLVLLVGVSVYSRGSDNPVRYNAAHMARGAAVFATVYLLATAASGDTSILDVCVRLLWLACVPFLLIGARVISRDELVIGLRRLVRRAPRVHVRS